MPEKVFMCQEKKKKKDSPTWMYQFEGYFKKTTVWLFQATNDQNLTQEDQDIATERKHEAESFLLEAQNNAISVP